MKGMIYIGQDFFNSVENLALYLFSYSFVSFALSFISFLISAALCTDA